MDDASAGGGEDYGDTMARRGGEKKPMKVARTISGMAAGAGEFSYTRNSVLQAQSGNILKPILEQEIKELELFKDWSKSAIRMADFGCSVGVNTLRYAEICYQSVCRARLSNRRNFPDEVQYFFCDLPSNDFNTLFLQLEDWRKTQTSMEDFYVTAVPGSFHRRLFPRGSLHVAISALEVHWMSQVPEAMLDKSSPPYNKGRVWIDDNKNVATLQAYRQIARQDLCNFLLSRAVEVISGGLVLFYTPRHEDGHHPEIQWPRDGEYVGPLSKVFETTWEELVIETLWKDSMKRFQAYIVLLHTHQGDLVYHISVTFLPIYGEVSMQGIIEEERRDTFNVPIYFHSLDDVKVVIESTNAFHIKQCEIKRQSYFPPNEMDQILANPEEYGQFTKNMTRSIVDSIMVEHIGEEKCHDFFERLERNAAMAAREKKVSNFFMDYILVVLIQK